MSPEGILRVLKSAIAHFQEKQSGHFEAKDVATLIRFLWKTTHLLIITIGVLLKQVILEMHGVWDFIMEHIRPILRIFNI